MNNLGKKWKRLFENKRLPKRRQLRNRDKERNNRNNTLKLMLKLPKGLRNLRN